MKDFIVVPYNAFGPRKRKPPDAVIWMLLDIPAIETGISSILGIYSFEGGVPVYCGGLSQMGFREDFGSSDPASRYSLCSKVSRKKVACRLRF